MPSPAIDVFHDGYVPVVANAFCVVGGFRLLVYNALPGSLLLGAYDGDDLRFVGVVNGFTLKRRVELLGDMQPYVSDLAGHPWEEEDFGYEWVPLRPELVCEINLVAAPWLHFVRWRHDVGPDECSVAQFAMT